MLSLIKKMQWSIYDITKGICKTVCVSMPIGRNNAMAKKKAEERTPSILWKLLTGSRQAELLKDVVHFSVCCHYAVSMTVTFTQRKSYMCARARTHVHAQVYVCKKMFNVDAYRGIKSVPALVAQIVQQRAAHGLFERLRICLSGQIVFT